eukprot:5295851-Amphidinium_carterae.1
MQIHPAYSGVPQMATGLSSQQESLQERKFSKPSELRYMDGAYALALEELLLSGCIELSKMGLRMRSLLVERCKAIRVGHALKKAKKTSKMPNVPQ